MNENQPQLPVNKLLAERCSDPDDLGGAVQQILDHAFDDELANFLHQPEGDHVFISLHRLGIAIGGYMLAEDLVDEIRDNCHKPELAMQLLGITVR